MRRVLRILLILFVSMWFTIQHTAALSQNNSGLWSPAELLGDGWWQSITVDLEGTAHLAWYDAIDNNDMMMYAARSIDGTWVGPNDVIYTGTCCWTVRNALAVTSTGLIGALFRNDVGRHLFASTPVQEADSAVSWSEPVNISRTGYYADMIADRNDVFHIIYAGREFDPTDPTSLESNPCLYCADLFYRRSTNNGRNWSFPHAISNLPTTGTDRPDIWEGYSGRLYIDWDEGTDWYAGRGLPQDVRLVYSDDGGETWSAPIILDGGDLPDRRPVQIATTELLDGALLAVWRYRSLDDRNIYYQVSSDLGESWSDPQTIPGIIARTVDRSDLDDYELITDQQNRTYLFAVGFRPGEEEVESLFEVAYIQGAWRSVRQVFEGAFDVWPEWPKAALGPQNDIHLSWFARLVKFTGAAYDNTAGLVVYYSHREGTLSDQPVPGFQPTAFPTSTPTLIQQFEPTLTPLPTAAPIENPVVNTTRDNYAAQTIVAGVMATALFCVIVVVAARFWPR